MNEQEQKYFCTLVSAAHSRTKKIRDEAAKQLVDSDGDGIALSIEYFRIISDWHHFAILELTKVEDFQSDSKWIAKRLNISVEKTNEAISRLRNLGLIETTKDGSFQKTNTFLAVEGPDRSLEKRHEQILQKSIVALKQPRGERDFSSITLPLNTKDITWAKEEIKKFRRKLAKKLASSTRCNRVYAFSLQLFALDNIEEPMKVKEQK